jgi:hypothetical protein
MTTDQHFTCKFFQYFSSFDNKSLESKLEVSIEQPELYLDPNWLDTKKIVSVFQNVEDRPKIPFQMRMVNYKAIYSNLENIDHSKTPALIPARDSIELLKFTFNNLQEHDVFDKIMPVLIDDRSTREQEMKQIADEYGALYIRIEYDSKTFNFSVINNAAASFLSNLGFEDVILWNSDLWVDNKSVIPSLLAKHKKNKDNNFFITGVKLLYPEKGFCNLMDDDRFIESLAADFSVSRDMIENLNPFGSVQFGGSAYVILPFLKGISPVVSSPIHYGRFLEPKSKDMNIDRQVHFMTGAFLLCDLEKYKEVGGLNPSLNSQFQDVDFCLKINKSSYKIMMYAKDVHLLHAESMSLASKAENKKGMKSTGDFQADMLCNQALYALFWNDNSLYGKMPS